MSLKILGISAFYHDSAVALVVDGEPVFAAQEERFSRKKHDPSFPSNALLACRSHYLQEYASEKRAFLEDLDAIVFYDKPFLKFERLLETYYAFAPRGLKQFLSAVPVWIKEKLFIKRLIHDELSRMEEMNGRRISLLFPEHHLSHAASAFYPSPFDEAAILTIDGVGEWATASIQHGTREGIRILRELRFPHSLGLLYSAFTYYTGFKVNSGEYKLMGLAPYGDPASDRVLRIKRAIFEELIDVKEDGSVWLNQKLFSYSHGLTMLDDEKWMKLFGFPRRTPETEISQEYCDMALAIQKITEDIILKMAREAKRLTGSNALCLAGGVALNCVANGHVRMSKVFDHMWIQPAAGDAGGALGAALTGYYQYFRKERRAVDGRGDGMKGAYLGPSYSDLDIELMARQYHAPYEKFDERGLEDKVAELLDNGAVVGWFQGRLEWGPRALGNRSILADARKQDMQKKLNLKIKYREGFRPFAPAVLIEDAQSYFEGREPSPYMLFIDFLKPERRVPLPSGFHQYPLKDKLYFVRSDIPAVTHLDFSARVQTVHRETNPRFHRLIEAFKRRTGYGILINTSFNVRGEPIVCTPRDAYKCFMRTEMDYLAIGDFLFDKNSQPEWLESGDWKEEYGLD